MNLADKLGLKAIELAYNQDGDVQISKENFKEVLKVAGSLVMMKENINQEQVSAMADLASATLYVLFDMRKEEEEKNSKCYS